MFLRLAAFAAALCLVAGQETENIDQLREDIHKAINELRAEGKTAAVTRSAKLDAVAQKHAENMARQDKVADDLKKPHVLDGKGPKERLDDAQYTFALYAENLAYTTPAPGGKVKGSVAVANAVKFWQGSALHYKNLMNAGCSETGVGLALSKSGKWYACQVFAAPRKK